MKPMVLGVRLVACTVLVLTPARAQDTSRVAPGDAVRVTAPSLGWQRWPAIFVGFQADSVVLQSAAHADSQHVVPFVAVHRLEVNHGNQPSRSWTAKYLVIGAGAGLLYGIIYGTAGAILYPCDKDQWWICDPWHVVGSFTVVGAAAGAIGGALMRSPPYQTVRLEPRPAITWLRGSRMGIGLALDMPR